MLTRHLGYRTGLVACAAALRATTASAFGGTGFHWSATDGMRDILDLIPDTDPLKPTLAGASFQVTGINNAGMTVGFMQAVNAGGIFQAMMLTPK